MSKYLQKKPDRNKCENTYKNIYFRIDTYYNMC